MAMNFSDKQNRDITAARLAGLIQAMVHEIDMFGRDPQTLLETEYLPLYSQLQELGFTDRGEIKWLLINSLERNHGVIFHKTTLGFGFEYRGQLFEVASKIEARSGDRFQFPSELRELEAKYKGYEIQYTVSVKSGDTHAIVRL